MLTPIGFSLYYHDGTWPVFLASGAAGLAAGSGLVCLLAPDREISHKDGFAIVGLSWLAAAALGAMPFYLSGAIPSFLDAYFEAMSGFTTTGSTILPDVELLGPGLLFWRSLIQWLGGMGIIVLSLAILPVLGVGGMQLFQAEVPGPTKDRLAPRVQDTARILWGVYVLFTALQTGLLMLAGMNFFDAVCHSFCTLATGGFSTKTASVAAYDSAWIDGIITLFMALAGINFALHFRLLTGNVKAFFSNEELNFYLGVALFATLYLTLSTVLKGTFETWLQAFRYVSFQVWSILTTTGFGTADFDLWSPDCKILMVVLMCLGGMAGSTAGGIKNVRILVFWKFTLAQIKQLIHPKAVVAIKLEGRGIPKEVVRSVLGYLALYMVVFVVATLIVTSQGVDIVTGSTSVIATLNNIGPGLAEVGPTRHFGLLSDPAKIALIVCMVAGRLELFTIAVLFAPSYWRGASRPKWRWQKERREKQV